MINCGHVTLGYSPYRNKLGETFDRKNALKWDNYYLTEETGGVKILENIRKLYCDSSLHQKIVHDILSQKSMTIRHII